MFVQVGIFFLHNQRVNMWGVCVIYDCGILEKTGEVFVNLPSISILSRKGFFINKFVLIMFLYTNILNIRKYQG